MADTGHDDDGPLNTHARLDALLSRIIQEPEKRQAIYRQMGEHIAQHLNLDPVRRYLQL